MDFIPGNLVELSVPTDKRLKRPDEERFTENI